MRFLSIAGYLTLLTIFVPASVNAQNTGPADKPGMQSAPEGSSKTTTESDKEEQPNAQSVDKTMEPQTTGHDELDSNVTRPRTRDDVIREILSNHSSDKHRPPVLPH